MDKLRESTDNMSAIEVFNMRVDNCELLAKEILVSIKSKRKVNKNMKDWGYAGSMAYIQSDLQDIENFLKNFRVKL